LANQIYDNHGVRFEFPETWELEETDHGDVATVAVSVPDGLGFAVITTDVTCPDPAMASEEALEALKEEYPDLDASPVLEAINGQATTGYDIEFFALDMTNSASVRCFRTPRRTVLLFGQWSDAGSDQTPDQIRQIFLSMEETESAGDDQDPSMDED